MLSSHVRTFQMFFNVCLIERVSVIEQFCVLMITATIFAVFLRVRISNESLGQTQNDTNRNLLKGDGLESVWMGF